MHLRQLSFRSQVKIVVLLLPITALLLALLFTAVQVAGGDPLRRGERVWIMLVSFPLYGLAIATLLALIQIAGLVLIRCTAWRGPTIELESCAPARAAPPATPDLGG